MAWTRFASIGKWRRAGIVLVGTAIALIAALATRGIDSSGAMLVILGTTAGGLTAVLFVMDRVDRRRGERDAAFRRVRQVGERLAIYDRESGLYAYWYFSLRLREELTRSRRYGQPLAVLLVESARGRLEHEEEQRLFHIMSNGFRETDLTAHLGSLRFAVLLPNTNEPGARVVAERLPGELAPLEVHVGRGTFPADGEDLPSLLRAAGASEDLIEDTERALQDFADAGPDMGHVA